MLAKPIFLRFLLLYWDIVLIYPVHDLFAGKTDTPFFCLEGTNGE